MIIVSYFLLYVLVNLVFQRFLGTGQRDIFVILARDGGTLGIVTMVCYLAGIAQLHDAYDVLIYISAYFVFLSSGCFYYIKRRSVTKKGNS